MPLLAGQHLEQVGYHSFQGPFLAVEDVIKGTAHILPYEITDIDVDPERSQSMVIDISEYV